MKKRAAGSGDGTVPHNPRPITDSKKVQKFNPKGPWAYAKSAACGTFQKCIARAGNRL